VPYTVVGASGAPPRGPQSGEKGLVSVVLLNRGARLYRGETIADLEKAGFSSIVSVEPKPDPVDVETLSAKHPGTRFLLLSESASPGAQINMAIRESTGPYVFVLWNDMSLAAQSLSSRFFDRVGELNLLCLAPLFLTRGGEALPTVTSPVLDRTSLRVLRLASGRDGTRCLYPFDFAGIYSKEKFSLLGGFDASLSNPYWQRMDFGFRSWLWGEETRLAQALKLAYSGESPSEDETPDECYKWFWLKNLAPTFRGDCAAIPSSRFWSYLRSRRGSPFEAFGEFKAASEWVATNRFRFRTDASSLVDLWEEPES
jgi:hypothetical protein